MNCTCICHNENKLSGTCNMCEFDFSLGTHNSMELDN